MHIAIWTTNQCNMKCTYCYEDEKTDMQNMSLETANQVSKYIKSNYRKDEDLIIRFHGGEPLLNFSVIKYLVEQLILQFSNIHFEITTNNTLMTIEIADFLELYFSSISISIDGLPEYQNLHRKFHNNEGSYSTVLNGLNHFKRKNELVARMTITPDTVSWLNRNVQHLIEIGFTIIEPVPDIANENWDKSSAKILAEEYQRLADLQILLDEKVEIRGIYSAKYRHKNSPCSGGVSSIQIAPNGNLYPCSFILGDKNYKLGDIWHDQIDHNILQKIVEMDMFPNNVCTGCMRYEYCSATRCKIVNERCTGDANTPLPIICATENIQYKTCKYYLLNAKS